MGDANDAEGSTKKVDQIALQAQKGLDLFKQDDAGETILDKAGAEAFKATFEEMLAGLAAEEKALTGKDNKKARTEKSKEISAKKNEPEYIDACKVCKGLEPKNGFFAKKPEPKKEAKKEEVVEEKKDDKKDDKKKPKKAESTGISGEERKELETLKADLIARKSELKAAGMSGGQQNKDEQVMGWVKRMNELKEKECPGSTGKPAKEDKKKKKGALSSEDQAEFEKLKNEIEVYKGKLKTEFGYSNKDIKADPELQEMEAKAKAFEKRA